MLGRDVDAGSEMAWREVAEHFAARQRARIAAAIDRVLSRGEIEETAPFVGAGAGRFLVRRLAEDWARPHVDFSELLTGPAEAREAAAWSAPAAAVALLAARR